MRRPGHASAEPSKLPRKLTCPMAPNFCFRTSFTCSSFSSRRRSTITLIVSSFSSGEGLLLPCVSVEGVLVADALLETETVLVDLRSWGLGFSSSEFDPEPEPEPVELLTLNG